MELPLFTKETNKIERYGLITTKKDQEFIISFLHPNNPYRSLAICYKVGSGKTYASACLAYIYISEGFKVLYLSNSVTSINSFNNEYQKVVSDSRFVLTKNNLTAFTFTKFHNYNFEVEYGLVIIDEAHNLRENGLRYKAIKGKLDKMMNTKILIISATPMIDSENEINTILSIANEDTPIAFSDDYNNDDLKINFVGSKINGEILYLSKLKGIQLKDYEKAYNDINDTVFTNTRQASISCNSKFDKNMPIDEQSSKMSKVLETLEEGKLSLIFCFYVNRGLNIIKDILIDKGYDEWDYNYPRKLGKKFALIDGKTNHKKANLILKNFNSISNYDGKYINVLIGSSVLTESITIHRIRKLHILSPFWNYGQIEQSIGRAIRLMSHNGLNNENKTIDIYLHAAYTHIKDNKPIGKDIDMWNISINKKEKIMSKLIEIKQKSLTRSEWEPEFMVPKVDGILVIEINEWVWDLRECFEHNKFKISWCRIFLDKAVGYDKIKKIRVIGHPSYLRINKPLDGYTIWRSCIDNNLRISFIDKTINKFTKRGLLLSNVKADYINKISEELGCKSSLVYIIDNLKLKGRYFDKQIEYDLR